MNSEKQKLNIADDVILAVRNLKRYFPVKRGIFKKVVGYVRAVDDVSFTIKKGETLGLVGESGCGKTTTGRSILRIGGEPTSGDVYFRDGKDLVNITKLSFDEMKKYRRQLQVIFQDPRSSLDSRMTVRNIVSEYLRIQGEKNKEKIRDKVASLLKDVGLKPSHMNRYSHEFSGGQRQRIGIARALSLQPELIICDEPVSALDVSVQAQIINLLKNLQDKFGLTYLFIAHDLSVVEHISDRVAVMYLGKIVELSSSESLYYEPKHPYTEALMSAVPQPDPAIKPERILLEGDVPDPSDPPEGCNFNPRCQYAKKICRQQEPELISSSDKENEFVACHFARELDLKGVEESVNI